MTLIYIMGAVVIGIGLLQIVAGDVVWKVDQAVKAMQGLHAERTDAYESGRILRGVVFIVVGIVFVVVAAVLG